MKLYTVNLDTAQDSKLVGRQVEPGEVVALDPDRVESEVDAGVADEFDGLSDSVMEILESEGIDPARTLDMGADGLTAIDGIGDKTAAKVLAAAGGKQVRSIPWLSESTPSEVKAWCDELRGRGAEDLARRIESLSPRESDAQE